MKKAILPDVVDVDTLFSEQAQKLKALIDEGYSFSVRLDSVEGRDRAVIVPDNGRWQGRDWKPWILPLYRSMSEIDNQTSTLAPF